MRSLAGTALQDGSVSAPKLAPLVPLLEAIEVPPDFLVFQRNDRLQVLSQNGVRAQLFPSAKKLALSLDPLAYWLPSAWILEPLTTPSLPS
jgi:hypothetical protein